MTHFPLLSAILLCPTLGLLAVLFTPDHKKNVIRWTSLIAASASLFFSIVLTLTFDASSAAFQFKEVLPWLPRWGIEYALGVDGISVAMILLTGIVIFCGVICSWTVEKKVKAFYANLLFLVAGVFGVFMSTNLFFFFLFYEIAVLPMYLLIVIWGSTRKEYAAMKLTLYLLLGSAFILAGFLYLYCLPGSGTFDLIQLKETLVFSPQTQKILFITFFVGFGSLAACWPFHVWSPDGHVAAPTAASMLHAGVLMKLGTYGILRVGIFLFPEGAQHWAFIVACLALCNVVYGALVATQQKDLKFMIGYSSVSHMGIVILGLSTLTEAGINGAVFQMFSHGIMTALFFACVGYIYDRCHTRQLSELGGLARQAPKICAMFIIAGLVGLGLPGFSGFVAEFLVLLAALQVYPWIGILSVTSLLITAYYVLSALQKAFYGPITHHYEELTDVSRWQFFPRAVLISTLLFFGLFPNIFLNWIRVATAGLIPGQ